MSDLARLRIWGDPRWPVLVSGRGGEPKASQIPYCRNPPNPARSCHFRGGGALGRVRPSSRRCLHPCYDVCNPYVIDVLDQAAFIVVHIDTRRDVHGRYQHHAFLNTTLAEDLFHLRCNMHVGAMRLRMKVQISSSQRTALNMRCVIE